MHTDLVVLGYDGSYGRVAAYVIDGKAPPAFPIDAPQALRLAQEPLANVGRYDSLRDGGLRHAS